MKIGRWARLVLAAAPLLAGCGNFWQAPSSGTGSFTLASNPANITLSPGSTGTSVITVTPGSSFTGTVSLYCSVTTTPANGTSCSFSPATVSISGTTAETSTLTVSTTSSTATGTYDITVNANSGTAAATPITVCAEVSTSGSTCTATASASGVFYVLNQTTSQVVAFSISSGQLTKIGANTLSNAPAAIAVAPNGKFLYVSTAAGIYLYTIGSGGALTLGNNGAAISYDPAQTMQVDATNTWLVDAVPGALYAIAINSSTGMLAVAGEKEQSTALPANTLTQLAISPHDSSSCADCYVFVGMGSGGTEFVVFNPGNTIPFGGAGHIGVLNSGGDNTVAVDPTNQLLYIGESDALPSNTQTGGLRVFTIANNGLTPLSGSPYPSGGTGPIALLPTADGNYVYIANETVSGITTGNIAGFSVTTSALTSLGTVAAGPSGQLSLAEDSTGTFLLAVDFAGNPDLEAYTLSSGMPTSPLSFATGTGTVGAVAIAAAP